MAATVRALGTTPRAWQVFVSDQHPDWAAWVDIRDRPARIVYWNHLALGDRQFLITDFRCAHEACHLEQPAVWSESLRETMADRCATAHTGERR